MDHIWKTVGFLGIEILEFCTSHPIPYHKDALEAEVPGVLLAAALLLVSVVCLVACVCCRENQRKGFKPDKKETEKEKEFRDSTHSLHHSGLSFTNPGLSPGSELAIFPPPGVSSVPSVTFEPLPTPVIPARKPPALSNPFADSLSDADWFASGELDFPRQQLQYLKECGRGWFGRVVEGEARGLSDNRYKVMVRILREDASPAEQKYFLSEAKPYRDLNHSNVLKLVGRCLETNPYLVLLEACSAGDLKSFLCGNLTSANVLCEQGVCLRIMCQVASGLQHMISHGFVHTDLAARNCQVTSDLTVKVGDYGTSIDTYKNEYYIAGDVAVPVRWCAPESLHCTATTIETKQVMAEANVWSLGVLLWEVCQFGQLPYSELTDDQVIVRVLGGERYRLPPPTLHPLHGSALYSLMSLCWLPARGRAQLDHVVSMLNHLQASHSEEDFQRRWDALRPNSTPEITLETMTARSDFDSGVDLEIKSTDREVMDLVKKSSSDVNMSPSTASPQLSMASSSGGEFFSQTNLSVMKKQSPSLTNLRGSVEDMREEKTEEFDSWLKGVETTNEEDVKFVKKISEAIKDLDDALALEKTSSSSDDSRQESPVKDTNSPDENPILDFRLGPMNEVRKRIDLTQDLQDDSLIRRDSSGTDTEDETWRGRIERGEFSEKVKEKSKSVTDLMILTHIESEGSESDSLPSLTRQYSVEKTKRKFSGATMTTIGFGSEGNIRGAVLGEEFQDALKQLQAEWKLRDMESRENSLQFIKGEGQPSLQPDKLNFLVNDASEQINSEKSPVTKGCYVNEPVVVVLSPSQISESTVVKEVFQGNSIPSHVTLDVELNDMKISTKENKEDNLKLLESDENSSRQSRLSPETTDISEISQNTESSSEISTPTQYEVISVLDNVQTFINSEKEHSTSLKSCVSINKELPSKILMKPVEKSKPVNDIKIGCKTIEAPNKENIFEEEKPLNNETDKIVHLVPNINDVERCPYSEDEQVKTNCDMSSKPADFSVIIKTDNVCVTSVDKCVESTNDVTELNNKLIKNKNDLLIKSATLVEKDFPSYNSVTGASDCVVSGPNKFDESSFCEHSNVQSDVVVNCLLLSDEQKGSTFIPEIVVTEASILDVESDAEPEIDLSSGRRRKRNVRVIISSSDDSEDEIDKVVDNVTASDGLNFTRNDLAAAGTPSVKDKQISICEENVSDVDLTFHEITESEPFIVPCGKENKPVSPSIETSVILGSCEDYTLDYFKGLKTTYGKQTSDESTDEFSKSEGEEEEKKQCSINNWDEFLTSSLHQRYQDNPVSSDVEFETSDTDFELNDKNREDNIENFNDFLDDNVDILKPKIKYSEKLNEDLRKNVVICDRMDIFENLNVKQNFEDHDQQMQEVKNRLEDVAMLSESFCLKNQKISMDDDEDGKLLTPDDERSSDSGFRDKGSLSESVEDACDEKYNLEDIDAELEEQYGKHMETKMMDDMEENKTTLKEDLGVNNGSDESTFMVNIVSDTTLEQDCDEPEPPVQPIESSKSCQTLEEISCLPSEPFDDKQERFNKLDNALNSNIDHYFETGSQTKTGWYLHPPPGTALVDSQPVASGWLPAAPEEGKDTSYVSFDIDEEFVTAIRNELREKLPCAQNPERTENAEEDVSPEEERTDLVIQYNTFPVPLSPIFEERESISSNQSSLLLDDAGKSIESSGKSSPVMYLDATKEDGNLLRFEDDIRNALDVCNSESTESDNILVTVEDLENARGGKAQKVVENTKDEMDDLLIVDTETNKVTLYESPRPRSQLAFVKQIVEPVDDNSSVNSETYSFYHSADDNMLSVDRNNPTYTPDSVSPLSSGSSRTGIAVSFSSSETGGNLSGFYLSPSSVRSDLFDNGPPSLPFDLGQMYEPVEEIRPNNEAEEIVQELVEAGMLKESDLKEESEFSDVLSCGMISSKESSGETSENVNSETTDEQNNDNGSSVETSLGKSEETDSSVSKDLSTVMKGNFNSNALQVCTVSPKNESKICDKMDEMLDSVEKQLQPTQEGQLKYKLDDSQNWLKSVLLSNSVSLPELNESSKNENSLVCLNNGWPKPEELMTQSSPVVTQVTATTPESPSMDLLEVAAKFYDVNSTLAISTPNNTSFDESKDNSQLSSFTSTPTLETKCITVGSTKSFEKPVIIEPKSSIKDSKDETRNIPSLSDLANEVVLKLPSSENERNPSEDSSPDDSERARRLQGMTLALEPSVMSKAPMPSPEDADKGTWRPTMGQLMELTNQPEQDDMMTTSFIDVDNNDYAPDWESDTSDDSEEHSSSSGEFIWREGDREEAVRVVIACDDLEPQEGVSEMSMARISEEEGEDEDEDEDGEEGEDNSSCASTTEFVPSTWDSNATPTKSALRSAEKQKGEKRNVYFKRQKYHCVYEYPREPSDSEDEEEHNILQRRTWQSPSTFDYSTYADWEYGEGEVEEAESDSDDNGPRQLPESEYDFYRLSNLDFDMMTQMNLDEGEFFISSSARPFQMGDSSQFFPGSLSDDDFLVEFQPCAADTEEVVIPSSEQLRLADETITGRLREVKTEEKQKPVDLHIAADPVMGSAEVSPTLGELRHTRQRLTLDLGRGEGREGKGEASLLDSGGEDSGVESTATGSSDRLDQVQSSEA